MFRLAKLSLTNRSVVALVTIIVAIFGFVSLGALKQELIPSFETPQAAIVTTYPGASPQVIDTQVSRPLEAAVRQQDGLVSSTSTSQNNLSILRVEFDYGTSTAKVKENLSAAIASVESTLPAGASAQVISGSFDSVPIVSLGVSSPNNAKIGKLLQEVAPTLFGGIKGVRDVSVAGVEDKRVNIKLDAYTLASYGLTQQNIVTALKTNGFIVPAGSILDSKGSISVEVGTPVNSLDAFKRLPLIGTKTSFGMTGPVVSTVALTIADVADVT